MVTTADWLTVEVFDKLAISNVQCDFHNKEWMDGLWALGGSEAWDPKGPQLQARNH